MPLAVSADFTVIVIAGAKYYKEPKMQKPSPLRDKLTVLH